MTTIIDPNDSVRKSIAGVGEGIENPQEIASYAVDEEEANFFGELFFWTGAEYGDGDCWIFAEDDSTLDLEYMR